jgi:hypothetical protein
MAAIILQILEIVFEINFLKHRHPKSVCDRALVVQIGSRAYLWARSYHPIGIRFNELLIKGAI